jgi:outer membrane protein assembly factor BamE (lipoprotein component of BamABCDE complex)
MKSLGFVLLCSVFAAMTWGQAAVESAVGAGASTGAAAGARGAGQAVGGVFGALNKTLEQAPKTEAAPASTAVAPSAAKATPAKAVSIATKPIDPAQVTVGMERDEVLSRFGEPATRTTQIRRAQMLDTFWYKTESKDELIISLTDGKVVSTVLASQRKRAPVASVRR